MRSGWLFFGSALLAAMAARVAWVHLDIGRTHTAATESRYLRDKPGGQGTLERIPPELSEPETEADRARAITLEIAGDPVGAEKILRETLSRYPNSGLTWTELCSPLAQQHLYDEMEAAARHAFELEPRFAGAAASVALAASWKGDHETAIAWDTRALALDPTYGAVYYNRGTQHYNLEEYGAAIDDLVHVGPLMPGSQYAVWADKYIAKARKRLEGATASVSEPQSAATGNASR